MTKTVNINLGGSPFIIDEVAYIELTTYLQSIEARCAAMGLGADAMQRVENQLADALHHILAGRPIATLEDVNSAIDQLAEPLADDATGTQHHYHTSQSTQTLYRDTNNKIVAGVCSGVSRYMGIEDPLWMRLTFGFITVMSGIGLPIYLVLWFIMPADDSAPPLAATGKRDPIDWEKMGDRVTQEFDRWSDKLSDIVDDLGKPKHK